MSIELIDFLVKRPFSTNPSQGENARGTLGTQYRLSFPPLFRLTAGLLGKEGSAQSPLQLEDERSGAQRPARPLVLPQRLKLSLAAISLYVFPPIWSQAQQGFGLHPVVSVAGHMRCRAAPRIVPRMGA